MQNGILIVKLIILLINGLNEKPITARQCIKDVVIIAKYKPELIDVILEALVKYEKIYDDSMQNLIFKDRQKAIRIIRQYTW